MAHLRLFLVLASLGMPTALRADAFDRYINPVLSKVPEAAGVKELKQLTASLIADHGQVLGDTTGALIVVRTNEGRWCKLLVQAARQRIGETASVPILLIERFVTYKE